jgi:hypothetical protein
MVEKLHEYCKGCKYKCKVYLPTAEIVNCPKMKDEAEEKKKAKKSRGGQ